MDAPKQVYREEAFELLSDLEDALIELEQQPGDLDTVNRIFRAMHTIKGSGAMFGFDEIATFTHTIETVYDLIREGKLSVDEDLISLTLRSCDQIKAMLSASEGEVQADDALTLEISSAFKRLIPAEPDDAAQNARCGISEGGEEDIDEKAEATFRIRFRPHRELFQNGTNPVPLLNELRSLGHARIICHLKDIPDLHEIDPEACYTSWDIILTTDKEDNAIRDVFIFVEHVSDIEITLIDDSNGIEEEEYKKIGEILFDRGDISLSDLENILGRQKKIGEMLVESGKARRSEVKSALVEQEQVRELRKKRVAASVGEGASSIRVASHKLDSLVNLVGELVTVQARLSQLSAQKNDTDLTLVSEEVERLVAELRDNAMGMRMLPIGTIFAKFKRLVRDLSTELGKEVNFTTSGEETELDKTVIDKLGDPLVHLIRNSIDHGIESPDARKAAGKPAEGTIRLTAEHSGANVLISVSDDGAGLDTEAIRSRAIEKGLISPDAAMSEKDLFELILTPGFSTAKSISKVSGRGVGMDVVTSSIESFGGTVEIASVRGRGTTITLKLPLTLAIIDGLLVTISDEFFVIPLNAVVECIELSDEDRRHTHGRNLARVREEIVPYIPLREAFALGGGKPSIEQVVVTEVGERRIGFVVDKVVGQHQTVIKNMGKFLRHVDGVSGATIMGDGTVALILDINKITQQSEYMEASMNAAGHHA
ncbi:MAG TPA: chemotaxis protein CheA [Deltaproteobacteria bacterium]|nr:chemotaxis protein CheA [Deltaproteobacteria bacterium]